MIPGPLRHRRPGWAVGLALLLLFFLCAGLGNGASWNGPPPGRTGSGAASATVQGKEYVFVFGGQDVDGSYPRSLLVYDPRRQSWGSIVPGHQPWPPAMGESLLVSIDNLLYAAGNSELWRFDPATVEWTDLSDAAGAQPPLASGAAVCSLSTSSLKQIWFFGGRSSTVPVTDTLSVYDVTAHSWEVVPKSGPWPSARARASCLGVEDGGEAAVWMYGAVSPIDVWKLDVTARTWTQEFGAPGFGAQRAGMFLDPSGGGFYALGGLQGAAPTILLRRFDFADGTLTNTATSDPPSVRSMHAVAVFGSGSRVLVFSGTGASMLQDASVLRLSPTVAWQPSRLTSSLYQGAGAVAWTFGGWIYVFGGRTVAGSSTTFHNTLRRISADTFAGALVDTPTAPSPRSLASACADEAAGRAFLFGGSNAATQTPDFWSFDHGTQEWTQQAASPLLPSDYSGTQLICAEQSVWLLFTRPTLTQLFVLRYDIGSGSWTDQTATLEANSESLPQPISACRATAVRDSIYVHTSQQTLSTIWRLDIPSLAWFPVSTAQNTGPFKDHQIVTVRDQVVLVTGFRISENPGNGFLLTLAEPDDPSSEALVPNWYEMISENASGRGRSDAAVAVVGNLVAVIGGVRGSETLSTLDLFDTGLLDVAVGPTDAYATPGDLRCVMDSSLGFPCASLVFALDQFSRPGDAEFTSSSVVKPRITVHSAEPAVITRTQRLEAPVLLRGAFSLEAAAAGWVDLTGEVLPTRPAQAAGVSCEVPAGPCFLLDMGAAAASSTMVMRDLWVTGSASSGALVQVVNSPLVLAAVALSGHDRQAPALPGAAEAEFRGGALDARDSEVRLLRCALFSNQVAGLGGAASASRSVLSVAASLLHSNRALPRSNADRYRELIRGLGGALSAVDSELSLAGSAVVRNQATHGGGGVYAFNSELMVEDSLLLANAAGLEEGLEEGGFRALSTGAGSGGAISVRGMDAQLAEIAPSFRPTLVRLQGSELRENSAGLYGGALFADSVHNTTLDGTLVEANRAEIGGGIYALNSPLLCIEGALTGNEATAGGGGGIFWTRSLVSSAESLLPVLLLTTSSGNQAVYGPDWATELRSVFVDAAAAEAQPQVSGGAISPAPEAELRDFYDQVVASENVLSVRVAAPSQSSAISGATLAQFAAGRALLDGVLLQLAPGLSLTLVFEVVAPLDGVLQSDTVTVSTQLCQPGTFFNQPVDAIRCQNCPAGRFQDQVGQTSCEDCPAGSAVAAAGSSSVSDCAACPMRTYAPNPGSAECLACEGLVGPDRTSCGACAPGEFINYLNASCVQCEVGRFSQNGTMSRCLDCDPGSTNLAAGATACQSCAPGTFKAGFGPGLCLDCELGRFSGSGAETCAACAAGRTAAADAVSCEDCAPGTYKPGAGDGVCLPCEAGFISAGASAACVPCGAGSISVNGSTGCEECAAGFFKNSSNPENHFCDACPEGSWSMRAASSCVRCNPGWVSDAARQGCEECPAGRYKDPAGANACVPCEVGRFQSQTSRTSCDLCPAGRFSDAPGAEICAPCPVGHAKPFEGPGECAACELGFFAAAPASAQCQACGAGQIGVDGVSCEQCPPGTRGGRLLSECEPCDAGTLHDPIQDRCVPCPAGQWSNDTGAVECERCPLGTMKPLAGSGLCTECAPGRIAATEGSVTCAACPQGTVAQDHVCLACPAGRHNQEVYCIECPEGHYSGAGQDACTPCNGWVNPEKTNCSACPEFADRLVSNCVCRTGRYMDRNELGGPVCLPCPTGANCTDTGVSLDSMTPSEDWWSTGNGRFYSCPLDDACPGGFFENEGCNRGYEGPVCGICAEDFYMRGGRCLRCGDPSGTAILIVLAVIVVGGLVLWLYRRKKVHDKMVRAEEAKREEAEARRAAGEPEEPAEEAKRDADELASPRSDGDGDPDWSDETPRSGGSGTESAAEEHRRSKTEVVSEAEDRKHAKAYAGIMAVVVVIALVQILAVVDTVYEIPWPQSFVDGISIFKVILDPFQLMGVQCLGSFTYYDSLLVNTLVPIIACAVLLITYWVLRHSHPFRRWCVRIITAVLMLCYPAVSLSSMTIFVCRRINGVDYLEADYRIQCYDSRWAGYVIYASFVIAVIPLGWPLGLFLFLWRKNRQQKLKLRNTSRRLGHLYRHYTVDAYYWSVEESVRKLFLTALIILFGKGTDGQLLIGIFISMVAHLLHTWIRPFKYPLLNTLQHMALFSTWLTLLLGLALRLGAMGSGSGPETLSTVVLLLHYVTIVFALLVIGTKWRDKFDEWLRPERFYRRRLREEKAAEAAEKAAASGKNPDSDSDSDSLSPESPRATVQLPPASSRGAGNVPTREASPLAGAGYQQQLAEPDFDPEIEQEDDDFGPDPQQPQKPLAQPQQVELVNMPPVQVPVQQQPQQEHQETQY